MKSREVSTTNVVFTMSGEDVMIDDDDDDYRIFALSRVRVIHGRSPRLYAPRPDIISPVHRSSSTGLKPYRVRVRRRIAFWQQPVF